MMSEKYLTFKDKPFVKSGNTIYYGDPSESCVAVLKLSNLEGFKDVMLPQKVSVQLWLTDTELSLKDRILKKSEKNNLYAALNIASIWLARQLGEQ